MTIAAMSADIGGKECQYYVHDFLVRSAHLGNLIPRGHSKVAPVFACTCSSRVSWVGENSAGFSLEYPSVALHAVSRDLSSFPQECLYLMIDGNLDEAGKWYTARRYYHEQHSGCCFTFHFKK